MQNDFNSFIIFYANLNSTTIGIRLKHNFIIAEAATYTLPQQYSAHLDLLWWDCFAYLQSCMFQTPEKPNVNDFVIDLDLCACCPMYNKWYVGGDTETLKAPF